VKLIDFDSEKCLPIKQMESGLKPTNIGSKKGFLNVLKA
jgi:hypothetical protein